MLPIAGQMARPNGLCFFVDTHWWPGGCCRLKNRFLFKKKIIFNFFFFFSILFFTLATPGPSASIKYKYTLLVCLFVCIQ